MEILCRKMLIQQNIMELQKNWLTCFSYLNQEEQAEGKNMLLYKCQNCYKFNQLIEILGYYEGLSGCITGK